MFKNLDPQDFLNNYWQKKPLFIKGAIPGFQSPLSMDELASLAFEEMANTRLVKTNGISVTKSSDYLLSEGPFSEEELAGLDKNWTLLIQEADHWSEEILQLRNFFSFIPHWRFDDVMASLGGTGGHVGAHLDWYDVFILQAEGTKKWVLEETPRSFEQFEGKHLIADLDVKLLSDFNPSLEFVMKPGDLLYIPIGHAHQGINQTSSLSYSFGLRAPTLRDMVTEYLREELSTIHEDERMLDDPGCWESPGQIPEQLLLSLVKNWPEKLQLPSRPQLWFGKLVTTPTRHEVMPPNDLKDDELFNLLNENLFFRNPHARLAYYLGEAEVSFFGNGERLALEKSPLTIKLMEILCNQLDFNPDELLAFQNMDGFKLLLRFLYSQQILISDQNQTDEID